jgi:rSAM/selenodomain-associated transferase 2
MAGTTVIIPTLNEALVIEKTLARLSQTADLEIIVVDGGSRDGTAELARRHAKVVTTSPGRARQMNEGARQAAGKILLFLHADALLTDGAVGEMEAVMGDPRVVGGAFHLEIGSPKASLRWIAKAANLRTRFMGIPYGDQGLFVRSQVFKELGGYPVIPLMEDFEFSRRLKRRGSVVILSSRIRVSSRRWDQEGVFYVTLRNQLFVLMYFLGVPPERLTRWYRVVR